MPLLARLLVPVLSLPSSAVLVAQNGATPSSPPVAQAGGDAAAIRAAALDYIEGWFAGDAERMARAVHPELVKRIVVTDEVTGRDSIDTMGATRPASRWMPARGSTTCIWAAWTAGGGS